MNVLTAIQPVPAETDGVTVKGHESGNLLFPTIKVPSLKQPSAEGGELS